MSDVVFSAPGTLTSEQLRAARGLLRWTKKRLATEAGIAVATVTRIEAERGRLKGMIATEERLRKALEAHGVEFIENGVFVPL